MGKLKISGGILALMVLASVAFAQETDTSDEESRIEDAREDHPEVRNEAPAEEKRLPSAVVPNEADRSPDAVTSNPSKAAAGIDKSTTSQAGGAGLTAALAAGMVEKKYEGVSVVEVPSQARRKIIDEATFKISEQSVQGILGEARYRQNKTVIVDKVFRQASRYIPVIKAGDLVKTSEGQKLSVTLLVNTKVLEKILEEEGLRYDNESAPMMVPFVSIEDQINNENYRWWKEGNPKRLRAINDYLESQLQKNLFNLGFYVQRPEAAQIRLMIPRTTSQEMLTPEQTQSLATRWNIPLSLVGDLTVHGEKDGFGEVILELHLEVFQATSGRTLAQLYRQSKLPKGETLETMNPKKSLSFVVQAYKDLGAQLKEASQKGTLNTSLVRLELQSYLPLNKYDAFKDALKAANRSIRQVRERLISSQNTVFEVELNGSINDLTAGLSQLTVGDRTYRLKGVEGQNKLILAPVNR